MATQSQLAANRENAQLSSGPKSAEGKATSSRNSLTHGLTAKILSSLPEAVQEEFYGHRDMLTAYLQPQNYWEETLLEIYAFALFQQQRAAAYEYVAMEEALANPDDTELRRKWENLMRINATKLRESIKALNTLQTAMQNRMIAKAVSEEFNKEVPASTPYVQTCSKKALRSIIDPYTLSLSSVFTEFEPRPITPDPKG